MNNKFLSYQKEADGLLKPELSFDIVKRKINMTDELRSKIKWACTFNNCVPMIKNGSLKIIEHTNLAYVEPHRVVIKEKLFLFFNNHEYFYIGNLENKYPIARLQDMVN